MNQLGQQTSPYLLQHANNPVHWRAWGPEALAEAKAADKPIIVSIGYSTCHWCHVMERESFEDQVTADLMNKHFVCIKVDREERPDVDRIYMEACQAISGGGGWPLNAFLLPDGRPFYAGTYYPPERKYNRPSWKEVITHLAGLYNDDRASLTEQADRLTRNIKSGATRLLKLEPEAENHDEWREKTMTKLNDGYDYARGGFGGAPKFPMSLALEALLTNGVLHKNFNDQHRAHHGMMAMLNGGIYDHLGGGFSRYTVDAEWRVPHFEKMLYDNALLLRLLGKLHLAQPSQLYFDAITETTAWLQREMALPGGGYRAALDADSEGVEGKYYTWTLEEIATLLPADDAELIAEFYGVTVAGNWEEEQTNILYRPVDLLAVAAKLDLPVDIAVAKLNKARKTLHEAQMLRIPPGADDKLILQWNALLISGWTWCYRATADEKYLDLATDLWRVLNDQLRSEGNWYRNLTDGQLGAPAFLDDMAALAEAALDLHAITFDLDLALVDARSIVDEVLERFSMPDGGPMFYIRPPAGSDLPADAVELFDNALPSGNSQMMGALLRLARLSGEEKYLKRGEMMLAAMAGSIERYPSSFGNWLSAGLLHGVPPRELVITGPGARAAAASFLSRYRPGLLIVASETAREDVPLTQNRYLTDSTQFFVCENQVCNLPVSTKTEALSLIDPE
ncbi:thioredoxin domain-containing protein [Neolewinella aurantiaca]|nr:thioredoxin domain-containing protein [Neolewinella aurantiaca]